MQKIFCDMCDKEIERNWPISIGNWEDSANEDGEEELDFVEYDLCESCNTKVYLLVTGDSAKKKI